MQDAVSRFEGLGWKRKDGMEGERAGREEKGQEKKEKRKGW